MPMNLIHRRVCNSDRWARAVEDQLLPWALEGVEFGSETLEIGPGYGATTKVLLRLAERLTILEVDRESAKRLAGRYGDRAEVIHGDGAGMPLPDGRFDSVVCFTMLHHVPSPELQDRLFAEAWRVLRPGGVFAGCDALGGWRFRMIHIRDTCVVVPLETLPGRLRAAGFPEPEITRGVGSFRFRARKG
ncbi:methyltransferase type 11 [Streptomyces varsoviensis]|uniref:Methyltransferase type 11 n=2 Tax=Streptomyces varsoviensis TaxID=67373 RepID=A0ABR5J2P3_9ACTN|nr:methyltransferase type 11 [Streptomyces varsoviensis]